MEKIATVLNEAEVPFEDVVEVAVKGLLRLDFSMATQNCWVRKGDAFTGKIRSEVNVKNDTMSLFEKSSMVSPYAVQQQQLSFMTAQ
uniref:Uncharacterized protein n=1 Tax=Leersia perrieri TaxID=77586 RepID=A0A0D9XW09_9ORYZ